MLKLGNNIKNFSEIYSLLRKNLAEYGEEFIKSKVDYVLKNFNDNIEENLKKLLTEKSIERKPDYTQKFYITFIKIIFLNYLPICF